MEPPSSSPKVTRIYLQDDYQLGFLPLPTLTGYISLAEPLTAKCRNFLNRTNVDRLDRDMEQLGLQILKNNEQLRKFVKPAENAVQTTAEQPPNDSSQKPGVVQATWYSLKSRFGGLLNRAKPPEPPPPAPPPPPAEEPTSILLLDEDDSLLTPEEMAEFEGKLSDQYEMLVQALNVLMRWLQLVDSLSNKRSQILSTRIWRSVWKSAYSASADDEYETSCLRVHSIMLTHLVASMTYNFARRCEIFQACRPELKGYSDQYQMAYRLWDQFARREILIVDSYGVVGYDRLPAEVSLDSCAFFMRLCLIRIQRAAIVNFVRQKNLLFDSRSTVINEETPDELAIDQMEVSRMEQEQILFGSASSKAVAGRRYRLGMAVDSKEPEMGVVVKMSMHLFILLHSINTNERLLFLSPDRKFVTSPTFSSRHIVHSSCLLDDLQHLDLFARSTMFLFAALCAHQEDKRGWMAQALYKLLQADTVRLYVRQDTLLQLYEKMWRERLLKKLVSTMIDGDTLVKSATTNKGETKLLEQLVADFGEPRFCLVAKDWPTRIFKPVSSGASLNDKMFIE